MRFPLNRPRHWAVATAVLLLASAATLDHLQRRPDGMTLAPAQQQWPWTDTAFALEPESLQLLAGTPAPVLTGRFSRTPEADSHALPGGQLLELQLPQWQERSAQSRLSQLPPVLGSSLQGRLLQQALESAITAEPPPGDGDSGLSAEQTQALHWLRFSQRQFIAPLPEQGPLQPSASLGQEDWDLRPATASTLLLGAGTRGRYTWSQPAFLSNDHGLHWHFDAQRQQPRGSDQQGWVNAQTGFIWLALDQALLLSHNGGSSWVAAQVDTPLPSGPTLRAPDADLPAMLQDWHRSQAQPDFTPAIWSDLPHTSEQAAEFKFLFHTLPSGEVLGWSTRWSRPLDANGKPTGSWQAPQTRRFVLEIAPHAPRATVRDIAADNDLLPLEYHPDSTRLLAPDGSLTLLREDGQLQYLDPATRRWQPPVAVPQPRWQRLGVDYRAWAGQGIWITQSQAPALSAIATCLFPRSMALHAHCNTEGARAYAYSRDQGRSWQRFQLPDAMRSHIVGWNERDQQLLVAMDANADAEQALRLVGYRLP